MAGQLVKWTNNSEEDITFVQLSNRFPELEEPFVIKAGETFEFRLRLRETGLWTYRFEGDTSRASILIKDLPESIKSLLPEEK